MLKIGDIVPLIFINAKTFLYLAFPLAAEMLRSRKRPAQQVAGVGGKRKRMANPAPMYTHQSNMHAKRDLSHGRHKPWSALGAWFMGPKAENGDAFQNLVKQTVDSQIKFRRHM